MKLNIGDPRHPKYTLWQGCALFMALILCAYGVATWLRPTQEARMTSALSDGSLAGWVIVVDAGHGGGDGGAVGLHSKVMEKELNLDVSLRLAHVLRACGAKVILTRDHDEMLCPSDTPAGKRKRLDFEERERIVKAAKADILLSIHMNQYPDNRIHGAQVFYQENNEKGRVLAESLQAALKPLDESNHRVAHSGDFFMLRIGPPAVLIECGFISNKAEEEKLRNQQYRQKIAEHIAIGLQNYVDLPLEKRTLKNR